MRKAATRAGCTAVSSPDCSAAMRRPTNASARRQLADLPPLEVRDRLARVLEPGLAADDRVAQELDEDAVDVLRLGSRDAPHGAVHDARCAADPEVARRPQAHREVLLGPLTGARRRVERGVDLRGEEVLGAALVAGE